MFDQIPDELKALKQWHMWKRDKDGNKIPIRCGGGAAKSNDPETWCSFEMAEDQSQYYSGLAFEITSPYTGIDLDNCLDDDGKLRDWAIPIVARLSGVSYAEVSPSGKGIKFITRARKPDGSRCSVKMGPDKQQLECYDHSRFWTITGDVYGNETDLGDGQEAVEWLCSEYLTPVVRPTQATIAHQQRLMSTPLLQRAESYVINADGTGVGDRNNSAFRLSGHLWSMVGDNGEHLTPEEVLDLMRLWNSRNLPPMDDTELQKVTSSSQRNGTPRAPKISQPQVVVPVYQDVDLSGILGTKINAVEEMKSAVEFPADCLEAPGLIGELVKYNLQTALYPLPELALAGALALLSAVTGGKAEGLRARTNIYVMGLAPSGGGKDYSRKLNRKILFEAGGGHICGPERIGSHAGIVSALAENWCTLFQIDEIGRLLATMQSADRSPHLYNVASVLMQIYSSADDIWQADAYGDRKKCKTLNYPHCVVYGSSVPDGFWESLSKKNLSDGLIGRFLVFENSQYVDFQDTEEEPLPFSVVNRCRSWLELKTQHGNLAGHLDGAHPRRVEPDEQASERLKRHATDISVKRKQEDPIEAAIWSRHAEKTNKLALLFACSRWSEGEPWPVIRLSDADRAISLNNYLTRRMLRQAGVYVSESLFEADQLKVLRKLQTRAEWTQTDITKAMRWLKGRERIEILQLLVDSGEIEVEDRETGGRPVRIFRVVNK